MTKHATWFTNRRFAHTAFSHDTRTRMPRWTRRNMDSWLQIYCRSFLLHSSHLVRHMLSDESALCSFSAQLSVFHFSCSSLLFAVPFCFHKDCRMHFSLSRLFQVSSINETLTIFYHLVRGNWFMAFPIQKRCHTNRTIEYSLFSRTTHISSMNYWNFLGNKISLLQFLKYFQMFVDYIFFIGLVPC